MWPGYRLQTIDKKTLGWVLRAGDLGLGHRPLSKADRGKPLTFRWGEGNTTWTYSEL